MITRMTGLVICICVAVFAVATQAVEVTYQEDVQNAAFATTSDCWIDDGILAGVDMGQHSVLRARPDRHSLIAFRDIIGGAAGQVGAGSTINSATLSLYVTTLFAPGYEAYAYRLLKDWSNGSEGTEAWSDIDAAGEFGTNWINATEIFGGSVVPWEVAGVGGATDRTQTPMDYVYYTGEELTAVGVWIDVDVTEAVQDWANGAANYGVFLKSLSASMYFASAENGNDALNPILNVDYTAIPEPASLLLVAAAVLGLRRKK
jgi:PEP-CTERM motif